MTSLPARGSTIFLFARSGSKIKRGVEFLRLKRNISKIDQKVGYGVSLYQKYSLPCYTRDTAYN